MELASELIFFFVQLLAIKTQPYNLSLAGDVSRCSWPFQSQSTTDNEEPGSCAKRASKEDPPGGAELAWPWPCLLVWLVFVYQRPVVVNMHVGYSHAVPAFHDAFNPRTVFETHTCR